MNYALRPGRGAEGQLESQSKLDAARPLFERAHAIRERVLGPDHTDTVATRDALAKLAAEGSEPAADG